MNRLQTALLNLAFDTLVWADDWWHRWITVRVEGWPTAWIAVPDTEWPPNVPNLSEDEVELLLQKLAEQNEPLAAALRQPEA